MKKIAYCISAYTEPNSLLNLVNALNTKWADFYIHIDKKVDISLFTNLFRNNKVKMENVFFLNKSERVKIYWGGYSQVQMQFNLIHAALNSGIKYVRIVNITGTDYPIKSNAQLYEMFIDTSKEYIACFDVESEIFDDINQKTYAMSSKYIYFYLMDINHYVRDIISHLRIKKVSNLKDLGYKFYFGSEYWALTSECLEYILHVYEKEKKLQNILRFSFVPSEAWIHTIFQNSPYKSKAIMKPQNCYRGLISLSPLTYFNYGKEIKVLDIQDYDDIVCSGRSFARKIIVGKSDKLIEKLNRNR